ncbi:MAG: hypothetical protein NDI94_00930, partial [Candidatus Woesearchaeota archaeon]|nr:hypothetical protein [Candidatus Woesearchaeota archaeon]
NALVNSVYMGNQLLDRRVFGIDYEKLCAGDPMYMLAYSLSDPFAYYFLKEHGLSREDIADQVIRYYVIELRQSWSIKGMPDDAAKFFGIPEELARFYVAQNPEKYREFFENSSRVYENLKTQFNIWSAFLCVYNTAAYACRDHDETIKVNARGIQYEISNHDYAAAWQAVLRELKLPIILSEQLCMLQNHDIVNPVFAEDILGGLANSSSYENKPLRRGA